MNHIKSYNKLNEEVRDFDEGFELKDVFGIFDKVEDIKKTNDPNYKRLLEISKKGNLYRYVISGQKRLTFGMLKALHQDALRFKKDREIRQGVEKFLWRIIPIAFAPIFFPIWLIAQVLGSTRALNKIMVQVLKMDNGKYNHFLLNLIYKTIDFTEGEITRLTKEDWFYKSFAIEKGLINMVKKEHMIEFAYYIVKKIQYQDDLTPVPPYYVNNEFRRFLNRKFRFQPPLPMKVNPNKHDKYYEV